MKIHLGNTVPGLASLFFLVAGSGVGCGGSTSHGSTGTEIRSDKVRIAEPAVPPSDAQQLASDNQAFAVDLYQVLRATAGQGNFVFSPSSISIALAMLCGGANGGSSTEIAQALHFALPPGRLHPAFDALDLALTASPAADAGAFHLAIANAVWGQRDYGFLPAYLDLLALNYGAGLRGVDFAAAPETARQNINTWVADNTEQKIPELLQQGSIDGSTRLVLTNAVYFLADWQTPFGPKSGNAPFHTPTGDVMVPLMGGPKDIDLWAGAGWNAAALPYVGGTASMIVIVPDTGTIDAFEQGLTGNGLAAIFAARSSANLGSLAMPRFKFKSDSGLKAALIALGMRQTFDPALADLSGIDGTRNLYVSDVVHQATIAVDEKGTEAAAATAVIISTTSAVLHTLVVDRPFLFFVRHDATGAILFQGRVLDPSK